MFTFKVVKQVRKTWGSSVTATPSRPSIRPCLEVLEDRTMPSASPVDEQPIIFTASPQAAQAGQALVTDALALIEQRIEQIAAFDQNLIGVVNTVDQVIYQAVSAYEQGLDSILGINPNPQNQASNAAAFPFGSDSGAGRGNSSGSGSGSGATMTHNALNQSLNNSTQQTGSGSGSGSSTTNQQIRSVPGGRAAHPLASPGSGSGSFGIGGSGTGSLGTGTGSGYATVSGKVWLDNNGDGSIDNGEQGYSGIEVDLIQYSTSQPGVIVGRTPTITNQYGYYSFGNIPEGPDAKPYAIQVIFSSVPYVDVWATLRGPNVSQIDGHGTSGIFYLNDGAWRQVEAGVVSMDVNTTLDDPNGPLGNNLVTLRDAIETGNNGGGIGHGSIIEPVRFINPANGQSLSGTISLQAALDPINANYNIVGPGASTLAVSGSNSFGVFTVNATSTISDLTIEEGLNGNGGGIVNSGFLTLKGDTIILNKTTGNGGGIDNGKGWLWLITAQIGGNSATGAGGGLYNAGGTITISGATEINGNKARGGMGGGICNISGNVTGSGGTVINSNATSASGGGVANSGTFYMTGGQISHNYMLAGGNVGGGVYNAKSMRLLGVEIQGNSAVRGGGIFTTGKLVMGQSTTISGNNQASANGAGIYVAGGTAVMDGGGITNNTAQQSGGGIYVLSGQLMLNNGVNVSTNSAVGNGGGGRGGGIYILDGTVTMSGGKIYGNSSWDSGGGIYNLGGTLTLDESVNIDYNGANNQGGGIYLAAPSTTTFNNAAVFDNKTNGNWLTTGWGVYWQNGATVNPPINLYDSNDPGGNPVKGP